MAEPEKRDKRTDGFGDLCKNGMDDMQYSNYSYNILAFFETKLRFFCKRTRIMAIIKNNYSNLQCATIQSRARTTRTGFVFKGKGPTT